MSKMAAFCSFALVVATLAGCSGGPDECENTLVLEAADRGTTRAIEDGCTSLVVSLAHEPGVTWDATPGVDASVLRFDYRTDTETTTDYFFTPLASGQTLVSIGAQPTVAAWSASVEVVLPE